MRAPRDNPAARPAIMMSPTTIAQLAPETAVTLLGGATAGIVNPVNPLLEAEQIAAILRETEERDQSRAEIVPPARSHRTLSEPSLNLIDRDARDGLGAE